MCVRRTIIGAALQQQSAFFQLLEFLHTDKVVVHSGNLPLSGLPSGTCQQRQQFRKGRICEHVERATRHLGGEGRRESDSVANMPTGMGFKSRHSTQGGICVYIMNSQRRWDREALNSLFKYEAGRK